MSDSQTPAGFDRLWQQTPWPDAPPVPDAPLVGRDATGFDLVAKALADRGKPHPVILEIGAEFGGSTRKFLELPGTYVISLDPWPDTYTAGSFPELRQFLTGPDAMYALFQSFTFDYRDRLATVRGSSPGGLLPIRDAGVDVDLVYVDGDHRYDLVLQDLTAAAMVFPQAVICGSDWLFNPGNPKYEGLKRPVQTAVRRFAAVHDAHVESDGDAWLIDPSRPFNLERPVLRFSRHDSEPEIRDTDLKGRITALERTVTRLRRSNEHSDEALARIEALLSESPTRRLTRTVRSALKRS